MPIALRIAGVLWLVNGIGFGLFCIPAIREVGAGRDTPIVMGFPAYGHGPFFTALNHGCYRSSGGGLYADGG